MLEPQEIALRLVIAAVLGSIVGLERERLSWAAGLRTHMLVCLGSSLFMIVSAFGFADILGTPNVNLDPSRIAAQVVSGIGFLGAGTIILRRDAVRGLTTAASIWTVAAIGLAVGGGLFLAAGITTVLVLLILAGLKPLARRFSPNRSSRRFNITVDRRGTALPAVIGLVEESGLQIMQLSVQRKENGREEKIQLVIRSANDTQMLAATERLRSAEGVLKIDYR